MRLATRRKVDPILGMGDKPVGMQKYGGPLWMTWGSLVPIPGIHQIVGHSKDDHMRENITQESQNYCLDVGNANTAAIQTAGQLSILRQ